MLSILTSLFAGGATGLVGAAIQKFSDYKTKKLELELNKQRFEHEKGLRQIDVEIMKSEWHGRFQVAETEGDAAAFKEALTSEPKRYSEGVKYTSKQGWMMVLLDLLRGTVRPALTIYLCAITTVIYFEAVKLISGTVILPEQAYDMINKIIATVLYLTTSCVLFWFGARNKAKQV